MKTKIDIERNRDTFKISVKKGDGKPTKVETNDMLFAKTTLLGIMDDTRREFFTEPIDVGPAKIAGVDSIDKDVNPEDKVGVSDKPKKSKGKGKE